MEQTQILGKERAQLSKTIQSFDALVTQLSDVKDLLYLAEAEQDIKALQSITHDVKQLETVIDTWELRRLLPGNMDSHNAYLEIQSGSGGTEAQDWSEMLLRMYLKWGERRGFHTSLVERSPGEIAGIKSTTVYFKGEYAYGWLRTETGVHRLVRLSPFDSNQRRHTSFASVFVSPEIQDDTEIFINPSDLRIDTYRASGAGGQHVQKTDSAVRITHIPSGVVVQSQQDRSQHRNRAQALNQLKAKLYALKRQEQQTEQKARESEKRTIGWGSQIRSYVLDDARIKDLRTGVMHTVKATLEEGDIDVFLKASLEKEADNLKT